MHNALCACAGCESLRKARREDEVFQLRAELAALRAENEQLRVDAGVKLGAAAAEVVRLRAALIPFAAYGATLYHAPREDYPMDDAGSREGRGEMPTVADCRRANAALASAAQAEEKRP